ncbi:MAG TPA: biotin transporter BioY [Actinomycetes bacterium]|nr:biotin transporter BioY [Actinomycetes bacterium]
MTTDAATLRAAVLPRSSVALRSVADVTLVLGGAALITASALVSIPLWFTPVPFTLQTFAVLAIGAALGSARGGLATLLYLMIGIVGFPVFAEGTNGVEVIFGATGGYLVGMLLAAVLVGRLAERRRMDRQLRTAVLAMVAGDAVILGLGTLWLAAALGVSLEKAFVLGVAPFLVFEVVKVVAATVTLPAAWKAVNRLRG